MSNVVERLLAAPYAHHSVLRDGLYHVTVSTGRKKFSHVAPTFAEAATRALDEAGAYAAPRDAAKGEG